MKPLATIAALLALTPYAHAQTPQPAPALMRPDGPVRAAPPPEFRNYTGKITIERVETPEQVMTKCNLRRPALACAYPGNPCRIIAVSDEYIYATKYTPEIVFTHERAHCAGWPASHPNSQVIP